ncbi:leucyl aminopeptidase [Zavarzinia sp.]|uniref:leucyl aminopeptidase n=1 Tax=Zavarzinia sp. TaxID=2027920 RepID=UPI00356491B2
MKIAFASPSLPAAGAVVVFALEGRNFSATGAYLDKLSAGALSRVVATGRFSAKRGEIVELLAPAGIDLSRVLLIGLGKPEALDALGAETLGGNVVARLASSGEEAVTVIVDEVEGVALKPAELAARIAYGALLRSYRFDKYHTKKKPEDKPSLAKLTIGVAQDGAAKKAFQPLEKIAEGVFFTRDLVTEPANIIYPETLAKQAKALEKLGVEVEVLGEAQMRKLCMGALLGVGQGSVRESQLLVMRWNGGKAKDAPVAFIGKGVTFDTGGISIKPAAGMEDMKWDMGGAGTVVGLMKALAGRKAKVNVVGVAGLVENMPSGSAQRPGDVVTSMSGQTIEVLNTDAEGRLVLADALWYTQDRFKPKFMIDLATLTGAIIIALGNEYAGLFSNDDGLVEKLTAAGKATGEQVWRLPLGEAYDKMLESPIADMQNISGDRAAGSITAAQFLQRFVNGVPWAHLDIAAMAWSKKDKPTVPKGGTGYGVRLLDRLVADNYEGK